MKYFSLVCLTLAMFMSTPSLAQEFAQENTAIEQTAPKNETSLPTFEMFGLTTNKVYDGKVEFAEKTCDITKIGPDRCARLFCCVKMGNALVRDLEVNFVDGRLIKIVGFTNVSQFENLRAAFVAKYGSASDVEVSEVQNRMGATFDNTIMRWAFADGVLLLHKRLGTIDDSALMFLSESAMEEPEAPVVNF